jgi:hypothetical protein
MKAAFDLLEIVFEGFLFEPIPKYEDTRLTLMVRHLCSLHIEEEWDIGCRVYSSDRAGPLLAYARMAWANNQFRCSWKDAKENGFRMVELLCYVLVGERVGASGLTYRQVAESLIHGKHFTPCRRKEATANPNHEYFVNAAKHGTCFHCGVDLFG